jgi:hypothetical protein
MKPEPESELDKAEAELFRRADAGELSDEAFADVWRDMEENTPVSEGEIAQENRRMFLTRSSATRK